MGEALKDLTTVALAIVGVAILAVLVSRNSNTTGVVNSTSSAFNTALATAASPVTGYDVGAPIYASHGSNFGALELGAGYRTGGGF